MSHWDFNSINSLFQQNQEKSQIYSQEGPIPIHNSNQNPPPDRETTIGFSHVFQRTINFNDIQRRKQAIPSTKIYSFSPIFNTEQTVKPPHIQPLLFSPEQKSEESCPTQNLKALAAKVHSILRQGSIVSYKEIMQILVQSYEKGFSRKGKEMTANDIKNLRRRLYDTVNVLEAAGIIEKSCNSLKLKRNAQNSIKDEAKCQTKKEYLVDEISQENADNFEDYQKFQSSMNEIQQQLAEKKKHRAYVLSRFVMLRKLLDRNFKAVQNSSKAYRTENQFQEASDIMSNSLKRISKSHKIGLPAFFFMFAQETEVEFSEEKTVIRGSGVDLTADWQALGYLFLADNSQIQWARLQLYSAKPQVKMEQEQQVSYCSSRLEERIC